MEGSPLYQPRGTQTPGGATQDLPVNPQSPPGQPSSKFPAPPTPRDPDVAAELALLHEIRDASRTNPAELAVCDDSTPPAVLDDFPIPGYRRLLIPRNPSGGNIALAEAVPKMVLSTNPSRLGASVINSGAKAVRLYLGGKGAAVGTVWLAAEGGIWDGRISGMFWGGSVDAEALGGASSVDVAEV